MKYLTLVKSIFPAILVFLTGCASQMVLEPKPYRDPTCANCQDPKTAADATLGMRLSGERVVLRRKNIRTNAGYGILVEDCRDCLIEDVTITGGRRDPDGQASDAAIVVRNSRVTIRDVVIRDNIGDPAVVKKTVVGIIGIAGREGADMVIERNRIIRNSWDGIALYRGAKAVIRDNVIDGVDKARGEQVGGGRGVGIGMTWDSQAIVERNLVTRYWKGIGAFVAARAEVRNNVIEDVITWGFQLWDAGKGDASALFENNAVYRTGACGGAVTREAACKPGDLCAVRNNAFVLTGLNAKYDAPDSYCKQEALARETVPAGFTIENNLFLANREAGDKPGHEDMPREEFLRRVTLLTETLRRGTATEQSTFARDARGLTSGIENVTPP